MKLTNDMIEQMHQQPKEVLLEIISQSAIGSPNHERAKIILSVKQADEANQPNWIDKVNLAWSITSLVIGLIFGYFIRGA
ncbi:hypothetical protein QEH52_01710 [Coraliomargarita sp. SDUM461003]|uniref:TMhelix containing protein n=1 Tax=Thalassobacterium maritimum TaxID=3041265 RepID=A0ABU1AQ88_9BACT|nr:hypothetical protein [Coraliomargarita sp. SDUM461003]MDQ8206208.1 hypothetical protein [Coraliomargarita sp. SDUM461003]